MSILAGIANVYKTCGVQFAVKDDINRDTDPGMLINPEVLTHGMMFLAHFLHHNQGLCTFV